MRSQVTKIQVGRDILILGDAESLGGLPHGLRRRSAVCGVLRRMATDAHAMRQLRYYWASRSLSQPNGLRSDRELLEVVEAAVERGAVPAMVIPDHGPHVRDLQLIEPGTAAVRAVVSRVVSQMTTEERLWEVVKRAAAKLPQATGEALLGLFTPENLAIAAGLAALSAAANLTPVGWAADAVMMAVAIGFGGLAAIQGLKDLTECFYLTANATTPRDLDAAATHLAKVIADFGVMWLMALLHERAKRGKGGGEGDAYVEETRVRSIPSSRAPSRRSGQNQHPEEGTNPSQSNEQKSNAGKEKDDKKIFTQERSNSCVVASSRNMIKIMTGKDVDESDLRDQVAKIMGEPGHDFERNGIDPAYASDLLKENGVQNTIERNKTLADLEAMTSSGKPVLIGFKDPGHRVLLEGVADNGGTKTFMVADPDPAFGGRVRQMSQDDFNKKYNPNAIVIVPK